MPTIPDKFFGEAMEELKNSSQNDLLARCIANRGSTDGGRAEYISIRAKQLMEEHDDKKLLLKQKLDEEKLDEEERWIERHNEAVREASENDEECKEMEDFYDGQAEEDFEQKWEEML